MSKSVKNRSKMDEKMKSTWEGLLDSFFFFSILLGLGTQLGTKLGGKLGPRQDKTGQDRTGQDKTRQRQDKDRTRQDFGRQREAGDVWRPGGRGLPRY